jgi:hypothetical protein
MHNIKPYYVISKNWTGQNIVIALTDWSEQDERGEVEEEGHKVSGVPSGIDRSFQIDLLKRSVNTDAVSGRIKISQ